MTKRLGGGLAETTGERHLVAQEALKGLNSRDQMSEALRNYGDVVRSVLWLPCSPVLVQLKLSGSLRSRALVVWFCCLFWVFCKGQGMTLQIKDTRRRRKEEIRKRTKE